MMDKKALHFIFGLCQAAAGYVAYKLLQNEEESKWM